METTHTMAGLIAPAGAARLRSSAPVPCPTGAPEHAHRVFGQPVTGYQSTTWMPGALADHAAFTALASKNRPPRPSSEPSP